MAGMLQMRRSRGAFSGFLLILLGLWGALIPFIGPYFHYAYTPDKAWTYNTGRLWLELLPGAAVVVGGFLLMIAKGRHTALFGALLAAAAGAWFTLGPVLSPLWNSHVAMGGSPASGTVYMRIMEQLGFFTALGVVIVFVAAIALGRVASVTSGIRPVEEIPETTVPADTVPVDRVPAEPAADPDPDGAGPGRARQDRGDPGRPGRGHHPNFRVGPARPAATIIGTTHSCQLMMTAADEATFAVRAEPAAATGHSSHRAHPARATVAAARPCMRLTAASIPAPSPGCVLARPAPRTQAIRLAMLNARRRLRRGTPCWPLCMTRNSSCRGMTGGCIMRTSS